MNTPHSDRDAALTYLARGWAVVPVPYRSKECKIKGWPTLRLTANDVAARFNGRRSNIGVLPGAPSGWRVDVDMDVDEAVAAGASLLPTTNLIHGRASNPESHRWYAVTGPVKSQEWQFTEVGSDKPTMLVELRANGRQTLVPPSVHPAGEPYIWHREGEPGRVAPDDLTRLVGRVAAAALIARHWPGMGSRDKAAMALAGLLLRAGWPTDEVDRFTHLVAVCARDDEYHGREKAEATFDKLKAGKPVTGATTLAKLLIDGKHVVATAHEWLGVRVRASLDDTGQTERPEEGAPLVRRWPKPLDEAAYHGVLGKIARELEPYIEADSAALLINLVAIAGVAMGRGPHVRVGAKRHYPCVYTVNVGATGDNKADAYWPIDAFLEQTIASATHDALPVKPLLWGGMSTGEGLLAQVRDERREMRGGEEVVVDAGVTDKRLLAFEPEFARVLAVMYREGNTLSMILRDLYDGASVARSSPKVNPITATNAHFGMIGQITPEELGRKLHEVELFNGFANRFLWVLTRRITSRPNPPAYSDETAREHARLWSKAIAKARAVGEVTRDEDAATRWEALYEPLRTGIQGGESARSGMALEVCARAHVHVLRIALIFAALDGSTRITTAHQDAALAIWDYAEASTLYLFGHVSSDPMAEVVFDALKARGALTRTQISHLFNRHVESGAIQTALDELASTGRSRMWKEATSGGPRELWEAL